MLLAMVQDVRVVLIKLADHLQELRYAVRLDDTRRGARPRELTRDIFAPLANRLGVWQLKWEMEDLAFRILEPADLPARSPACSTRSARIASATSRT